MSLLVYSASDAARHKWAPIVGYACSTGFTGAVHRALHVVVRAATHARREEDGTIVTVGPATLVYVDLEDGRYRAGSERVPQMATSMVAAEDGWRPLVAFHAKGYDLDSDGKTRFSFWETVEYLRRSPMSPVVTYADLMCVIGDPVALDALEKRAGAAVYERDWLGGKTPMTIGESILAGRDGRVREREGRQRRTMKTTQQQLLSSTRLLIESCQRSLTQIGEQIGRHEVHLERLRSMKREQEEILAMLEKVEKESHGDRAVLERLLRERLGSRVVSASSLTTSGRVRPSASAASAKSEASVSVSVVTAAKARIGAPRRAMTREEAHAIAVETAQQAIEEVAEDYESGAGLHGPDDFWIRPGTEDVPLVDVDLALVIEEFRAIGKALVAEEKAKAAWQAIGKALLAQQRDGKGT